MTGVQTCALPILHPGAVEVILRAKSPDKTVLITDCMMAGGMKDGDYKLGEFDVKVEKGTARLWLMLDHAFDSKSSYLKYETIFDLSDYIDLNLYDIKSVHPFVDKNN